MHLRFYEKTLFLSKSNVIAKMQRGIYLKTIFYLVIILIQISFILW